MEFTPFRLFVSAIATTALLFIFFFYFAPFYLWPQDAQKQIENALATAMTKPGKAIEAENTVFESQTAFSRETFSGAQIETNFECNSATECCDKGTQCGNAIEWTESRVSFKQKKSVATFTRCETGHNVAACTVYFGQKPAQVKIISASGLREMDLEKENNYSIDLLVKNDGSIFAPSIIAKTRLYKTNSERTITELLLEKTSEEIELSPGEKKMIPINLEIELAAGYIVEMLVEGENSGFDEKTVEFEVVGKNESFCNTAGKGENILNSTSGKCEQGYYCSNCYYAFDCRNAWQKAEPEKTIIGQDPRHAIAVTEPVNGECIQETATPENNTTSKSGFCNYGGEITAANNPSSLGNGCTENIELLKKYIKQNGLEANGIDLLLVEALIQAESSCSTAPSNGQGLMQVVSCAVDNCSVEENINTGTQLLNESIESAKGKGISGIDAITLALFGYNRGTGSASKAIELMDSGKTLQQAMLEACYYYFDKGSYGNCGGFSREKCCNAYGLGAQYPQKVLDNYSRLCVAAGGAIS